MQLAFEEKTYLKYTKYYLHKLVDLGQQYAKQAHMLNNVLLEFDVNQEQFRHARAWIASHLHLGSDIAKLCVDYCIVASDLIKLRLLPSEYLQWLSVALKAADLLPERYGDGEARLWIEVGNTYMSIGQYDHTKQAFQKALKVIDFFHLEDQRRIVQYSLDMLDLRLGNLSSVLSERTADSSAYDLGKVFNQANALMLKNRYREASTIFEQLLEKARETNDTYNETSALIMLASAYANMGDSKQGLAYGQRALALSREADIQPTLSEAINVVGTVLFSMKAYDEALPYLLESLEIETKLNNRRGMADSYQNIGNIYFMREDYSTALDYFQKAGTLFELMGVEHGVRAIDRLISQCNLQTSLIMHLLSLNPLNHVIHPLVSHTSQRIRNAWQRFQERKDYK